MKKPVRNTASLNVSIPPEIIEAVKAAAEADRRSTSNYVTMVLAEHLAESLKN